MVGKLTDIPKELVVSTTWEKEYLRAFFHSLAKGNIFGYSQVFTLSQIKKIALDNGVGVQVLPKSNALYKKYGEYVLRVIKPYTRSMEPLRVHFEDIHYMDRKYSPGNRKCCRYTTPTKPCPNTISKGEEFLEITDLKELHTGRKAYVKTSLCGDCAEEFIKSKIIQLLRILTRSTGAIDPIIKAVKDL